MPILRVSVVKLKGGLDISKLQKARDVGQESTKKPGTTQPLDGLLAEHWHALGTDRGVSITLWASEDAFKKGQKALNASHGKADYSNHIGAVETAVLVVD